MTEAKNNEKTLEKKRERNYGIDLLRILSMFMVTLLHFSGHREIRIQALSFT